MRIIRNAYIQHKDLLTVEEGVTYVYHWAWKGEERSCNCPFSLGQPHLHARRSCWAANVKFNLWGLNQFQDSDFLVLPVPLGKLRAYSVSKQWRTLRYRAASTLTSFLVILSFYVMYVVQLIKILLRKLRNLFLPDFVSPLNWMLERPVVAHLFKMFSAFHGISLFFVHKIPSLHPVLRHINSIHILTSCYVKTSFSIIFPSLCVSTVWSLPLSVTTQNVWMSYVFHVCCMPRPSHLWFDHLNYIRWKLQIMNANHVA